MRAPKVAAELAKAWRRCKALWRDGQGNRWKRPAHSTYILRSARRALRRVGQGNRLKRPAPSTLILRSARRARLEGCRPRNPERFHTGSSFETPASRAPQDKDMGIEHSPAHPAHPSVNQSNSLGSTITFFDRVFFGAPQTKASRSNQPYSQLSKSITRVGVTERATVKWLSRPSKPKTKTPFSFFLNSASIARSGVLKALASAPCGTRRKSTLSSALARLAT